MESQNAANTAAIILDQFTRNELSTTNNNNNNLLKNNLNHSPKVFTADTVTVNASARDVLGTKFTNFTRNLNNNNHTTTTGHNNNNYVNMQQQQGIVNNGSSVEHNNNNNNLNKNGDIMTAFNNLNGINGGHNGLFKVQNTYDRYPKSRGGLQVFHMNGVNEQINNEQQQQQQQGQLEGQRQRAHNERVHEQEVSRAEQERLEEILQLCAEYERQNSSSSSNITASPIVQNRIKTNGSLPREKKSPFGSEMNSPLYNDTKNGQVFFPSDNYNHNHHYHNSNNNNNSKKTVSTGYENVALIASKKVELGNNSGRYENVSNVVGNTHEYPLLPKKPVYVPPQSPRTKIRTNCQVSPKTNHRALTTATVQPERKLEYDILMKTFEDRQLAEDIKHYSEAEKRLLAGVRLGGDVKSLTAAKRVRNEVLKRVRELKTQIADLQRQEDEVLREVTAVNHLSIIIRFSFYSILVHKSIYILLSLCVR